MSSTFSTMINFGMLGLLRRLHRLHIQFTLEAQIEITGIRYPRVEAHKAKDGCGNEQDNMGEVHSITEADIASAVETARSKARYLVETIGVDQSLRLDNCLDNPPVQKMSFGKMRTMLMSVLMKLPLTCYGSALMDRMSTTFLAVYLPLAMRALLIKNYLHT